MWIPIEQGALIGLVSASGRLRFPVLEAEQVSGFADEMSTMEQLRTAAREQPPTTAITTE